MAPKIPIIEGVGNPRLSLALVARLHHRANAGRWGLSVERFSAALETSLERAFADAAPHRGEIERYLDGLHLEDLALACACADGHEEAWDEFVREQRPVLYRAADAIDPAGGARELADSLYGELFGVAGRDGQRLSLFRYFHGRSSLATWLRAILAQRHVDCLRRQRRLDPLPVDDTVPAQTVPANPNRPRFLSAMRRAVAAAVERLAPRDRLRLALYYVQDLTLAQTGRTLGEHEATASRHLSRTRRAIRKDVEQHLREHERMSEAEMSECFESIVEDAGTLDLGEMFGASAGRKNAGLDRST
jgi:RNA polymerase sigma factor (sigma-70 family)